jgi:hypothetical protein
VALKKAPMGRLFKLNMPEVPILLLGSIAASVHGVIFPMFGIIISGAIKSFYEPPDKAKKDTSFWVLICVVMGVACLISIPAEYSLFAIAGDKLIERIRNLSFQSIVHQEVAWFDKALNSRYDIHLIFYLLFSFLKIFVRFATYLLTDLRVKICRFFFSCSRCCLSDVANIITIFFMISWEENLKCFLML